LQGDWFCPLCAEAGINSKPEPLPLQPKQVGMLKPLKSSGKARPSSSGRLSIKGRGGSGEGLSLSQGSAPPPPRPAATGRVHMAAPTAPRMPRLGRPGARSNKNKRLFEGEEGALVNGQKLFYRTTQVGCRQPGVERGGAHAWKGCMLGSSSARVALALTRPGPVLRRWCWAPICCPPLQGETLLEGTAVVEPGGPSGILCGCCSTVRPPQARPPPHVWAPPPAAGHALLHASLPDTPAAPPAPTLPQLISASGFEAHAGRGQRRAPYDNIFTEDGLTLKAMAAMLPDLPEEGGGGGRGGGDYGLDDMADE
jgi:hypothetical protein